MLTVPDHLERLLDSRAIELTIGCEGIVGWGVVGKGNRVAEIAHVKLEPRYVPTLVYGHIEKTLIDSLSQDGPYGA